MTLIQVEVQDTSDLEELTLIVEATSQAQLEFMLHTVNTNYKIIKQREMERYSTTLNVFQ